MPFFIGLLLLSYRFIDFGAAGILFSLIVVFTLIYYQQASFRHACTELISESIAKPSTITLWLLKRPLLRIIIGVIFSSALTVHLLIFIYLANTWFLLFVLLDSVFVVFITNSSRGILSHQLHERAASIAREAVAIFINVIFMFAIYVALDVWLGNQLTPDRLNSAIGQTNEKRSLLLKEREDTSDQRPLKVFDDRLPLIAREEIQHSCHQFTVILRVASAIDLNAKSLRLQEEWGATVYWTVYITSLSLLPFIGFSLLYRSAMNFTLSFQRNAV